jgi:transcriptional/translational regulatory protein YebC/TACO1
MAHSELTKIAQSTVSLSEKDAEKVLKLYEAIDELDDVQHVYANFDIPDSVMEKISSEVG